MADWLGCPRIRPEVFERIFTSNRSSPRADLHRERVGSRVALNGPTPSAASQAPGFWGMARGDSRPQIANRGPPGFSTTCASGWRWDGANFLRSSSPDFGPHAKPGGERKYPTAFLGDRDSQQERGKRRSLIRNAVERALSGFLPLSFSILYVHPMRQFTAKPLFYPFRWVHGALLSLIQ